MFHLQKRLRNSWVWRMNRKVLSMEPRKLGHNLSSSKPPKIWFLEWMTNVRKFSTLIKLKSGLNGWTSFLVRTLGWNLMISNYKFQLIYVSEPTFVLRRRATVVIEMNGTVYTVFLAPRVMVASHVILLSILSWSKRWDLSTCLQCSNCVDCTEPMANAKTVLPWFLGNG